MIEKLKRLAGSRFGRQVDWQILKQSYGEISPPALADLAEFCGAVDPLPADPVAMQRRAGRLDVWRRIAAIRGLREEESYALLKGEPIVDAVRKYRDG